MPSSRSAHTTHPSLVWVLALALAPALGSCKKEKGGSGEDEKPAYQNEVKRESRTRVQVAPVVQKEMVRTLSVTRAIESENEIEVLPRTMGTVIELLVDEGDLVEANQVLARMDARESDAALRDARLALTEARGNGPRLDLAVRQAQEQLERAKLTHSQAEREYERNKGTGFVSSSDLEKMELTRDQSYRDWQAAILSVDSAKQDLANQGAVIDRALLAVEKAELDRSFFDILAPFAGTIAERKVNLGASVGPSAGVFLLTDPTQLRAVLYRPQKELDFFQQAALLQDQGASDLSIVARPEAYRDQEYTGRIRRVSSTIDAQSGSIRVTIDLAQPAPGDAKPPLMPGMMVRLSVVTERHPDAIVVQKRSLRREGDLRYLFVIREGLARRVEVEEGLLGEREVEVIPVPGFTLAVGEPVVVVGGRDLEDGQAVMTPEDDKPEALESAPPADPATADKTGDGTTESATTQGDSDSASTNEASTDDA